MFMNLQEKRFVTNMRRICAKNMMNCVVRSTNDECLNMIDCAVNVVDWRESATCEEISRATALCNEYSKKASMFDINVGEWRAVARVCVCTYIYQCIDRR